ncbi:MAG: Snf7 family protein [Candidatus Thorarchaeota archaeon]|nr:Snf7 family protein [Candidatus Thorarchaeota archaeon]
MGFLSGKKKVDAERGILEIKGTMNALTLRVRRLETRQVEEQAKAKESMARGDRTVARSHLSMVVEYENRRSRYQQQFLTLETALMNIEEAKDQSEVLRAFTIANDALVSARAMLNPAEIQSQLDKLSQSFEEISIAGELLSEDLSSGEVSLEAEERIDRQLDSMEAEILLEKEGVLPPLGYKSESKISEAAGEKKESRIDDLLADLEKEAKDEREREAQK